MDITTAATTVHEAWAAAWAIYNGQRGTVKQVARIMRQLSVADLQRMMAERDYAQVER